MDTEYDLIIIGGGIAGMTAAIYAARANLRTLLLEKMVCGGLVNTTHVVENFPSYPSINGMELMEKVRSHVDALGVTVTEVVEIEALDLRNDMKSIGTDEGRFQAPAVVLATGRTPKKLPIETELEQIHYCAICDGSPYRGRDVLVVGGGNSGVDESLYLLSLGVRNLTLIEEFDRLLASEMACSQLKAHANVETMTSTRIQELRGTTRLESVVLYDAVANTTCERKVDGIFVYIGQEPQTEMLRGVVELSDAGYIVAGENMETNLSGVFAAGDVIDKKYRQITTAMNDGTIAALAAAKFIGSHKTKTQKS
jgi:thioredoxin reductase (NADPH)